MSEGLLDQPLVTGQGKQLGARYGVVLSFVFGGLLLAGAGLTLLVVHGS